MSKGQLKKQLRLGVPTAAAASADSFVPSSRTETRTDWYGNVQSVTYWNLEAGVSYTLHIDTGSQLMEIAVGPFATVAEYSHAYYPREGETTTVWLTRD